MSIISVRRRLDGPRAVLGSHPPVLGAKYSVVACAPLPLGTALVQDAPSRLWPRRAVPGEQRAIAG